MTEQTRTDEPYGQSSAFGLRHYGVRCIASHIVYCGMYVIYDRMSRWPVLVCLSEVGAAAAAMPNIVSRILRGDSRSTGPTRRHVLASSDVGGRGRDSITQSFKVERVHVVHVLRSLVVFVGCWDC